MVTVSVEAFGRILPTVVVFGRGRMPWSEVVEQGPCPAMLVAGVTRAVQMLAIVEVAVHRAHQTVQHVTGTMTVGMVVGDSPQVPFVAEVDDLVEHDSRQASTRPVSQAANTLREAAAITSVIGIPNPVRDIEEQISQMLCSIANLQPRVQETSQDRHQWKENLPGGLSAMPTISVDRLRGVFGLDVAGFLLKNAVGFLQVVGAGAFGQGRPQHTALSDRGGDIVLFSVASGVMFIGQQVSGQLGSAYGGAHEAVASEPHLQAIPVHGVPVEDPCQSPERHAELAQEQRVLDLLGPGCHVGHQKRRTDRVRPALAQDDPTQGLTQFHRSTPVFHGVPSREALRKQLRHLGIAAIQPLPKTLRILHDCVIFVFLNRKANGSMPSIQIQSRSFGHDPPPCDKNAFGGSWPFS